MSDDKAPDTEQVLSADIIDDADEATRIALDPEHALERVAFWKAMSFEADKRVKELEARDSKRCDRIAALAIRLEAVRIEAQKADNSLAIFQQTSVPHDDARMTCGRAIHVNQARAALTKALEGWE